MVFGPNLSKIRRTFATVNSNIKLRHNTAKPKPGHEEISQVIKEEHKKGSFDYVVFFSNIKLQHNTTQASQYWMMKKQFRS